MLALCTWFAYETVVIRKNLLTQPIQIIKNIKLWTLEVYILSMGSLMSYHVARYKELIMLREKLSVMGFLGFRDQFQGVYG